MGISKIKKRDGRIVRFEQYKVINAILKAMNSVGIDNEPVAARLAGLVVENLEKKNEIPNVEHIQDSIERVLIEQGQADIAKAFILYRAHRQQVREAKESLIGISDDSILSVGALKIAEAKYLKKDDQGNVIESPNKMFRRVAKTAAKAESLYTEDKEFIQDIEDKFYASMKNLEFIPGGRVLANAGTKNKQYANCYVLPIEDSIENIFKTLLETVMIHKTGGGTGFSFSKLRPKGSQTTLNSYASGPVSFIHIFNQAGNLVSFRGIRKSANMGVLSIHHPDILEFISAKEDLTSLENFNLSVGVTDRFMTAVKKNHKYDLVDPHNDNIVDRIEARKVFDILVTTAWKNGEPGILFMDKINKKNKLSSLGELEATSPCGEIPLYPYENCVLGAINLEKFIKNNDIDFDRLEEVIKLGVRFLDNLIDVAEYPLDKTNEIIKKNRKIGLGVMGFANLLYALSIPYDSEEGVKTAEKIMSFIKEKSRLVSHHLALEKGPFPNFSKSNYEQKMRNSSITSLSPTGTRSMLAESSPGIEPNYAICYMKNVLSGSDIVYVNKQFEKVAKDRGFYSTQLIKQIIDFGSVQKISEVPSDIRKVFKMAHEISPEWHVKIQAAFQKYTDGAISKTVNFPHTATMKEVEDVFFLAYDLGCKGITIYRDGSRENQVLKTRR